MQCTSSEKIAVKQMRIAHKFIFESWFAMATQEKIESAMADDAHVSLAMAAE